MYTCRYNSNVGEYVYNIYVYAYDIRYICTQQNILAYHMFDVVVVIVYIYLKTVNKVGKKTPSVCKQVQKRSYGDGIDCCDDSCVAGCTGGRSEDCFVGCSCSLPPSLRVFVFTLPPCLSTLICLTSHASRTYTHMHACMYACT